MPILKRSGRPSYGRGFARSASESEAPGLWKNVKGLWLPTLGRTEGILRDHSGFGRHGTINGTTWAIDLNGPVLRFDGVSNRVVGPTIAELGVTNKITLAVRVKVTRILSHDNIWYINGAGNNAYLRTLSSGWTSTIFGSTSNFVGSTGALSDDEWHDIVVTVDAGDSIGHIYADGQLKDTDAIVGPDLVWATGPVSFGATAVGSFGVGADLSWAIIWNRILAAAELKQLHEQPEAMFTRRRRIYASVAPTGFVPYPHVPGMTGGIAI